MNWRKYETEILKIINAKYPEAKVEFNDQVFGKFSKVDRQIDISFRVTVAGYKLLGIIDCKYYSKNIDVKVVDSMLGMMEDVSANIGIIITNKGFSKAAYNRARVRNLELDIIDVENIDSYEIDFDMVLSKKIRQLDLSKSEFYERLEEISITIDKDNSSYSKRIVVCKDTFANTRYYGVKGAIKLAARLFRDFTDLDKIKILVPVKRNELIGEFKAIQIVTEIKRSELEDFLELDFEKMKSNIKIWRKDFMENRKYSKEDILKFESKFCIIK